MRGAWLDSLSSKNSNKNSKKISKTVQSRSDPSGGGGLIAARIPPSLMIGYLLISLSVGLANQ